MQNLFDKGKEALSKGIDKGKEVVDKGIDKGKEVVSDGVEAVKQGEVQDHVKEAFEKGKNVVQDAIPDNFAQMLEAKTKEFKAQMEQFAQEKQEMIRKFKEEKMMFVQNWVMSKLDGILDSTLGIGNQLTKESLKDPYMPMFVQGWVDDIVDSLWPDVVTEVKAFVMTGFLPEINYELGITSSNCCWRGYAWVRYQLFPFDGSIWRKLRNPFFVLWQLISLIPFWGVPQVLYVLQFIILDKSDEYMMMTYIVSFKVVQFFTIGVLSAFVGSIQYYLCTSKAQPDCNSTGPKQELFELITFLLQVVMVWIAFLCLGSAKKKGGYYEQYQRQLELDKQREAMFTSIFEKEGDTAAKPPPAQLGSGVVTLVNKAENENKGHSRLLKFMLWDVFVFLVCIGLGIWASYNNLLDSQATTPKSGWDNWKLRMTWFWLKSLYGLLSFPFLVLVLPVISTLVTHAKPTAFNRFGDTVPYIGKEPPPPPKEEEKISKSVTNWATKTFKAKELSKEE